MPKSAALRGARSPRALASRIWQRRTTQASGGAQALLHRLPLVVGQRTTFSFAHLELALCGANGQPLSWSEAIVVSITAFHERGFFSSMFQPGDLQAAVAVEAFIGLLIEIVFVATFTQRFFAR
jgi:hypothetical protein